MLADYNTNGSKKFSNAAHCLVIETAGTVEPKHLGFFLSKTGPAAHSKECE